MKAKAALTGLRAATFAALLLSFTAIAADDISEAFDLSIAAQRAASASQARVDKLDAETRALREKRKAAQWRALQLSAYAAKLEQDAAVEEKKRKDLEDQIQRIASTGTDLMPLMRRMVAELDSFVAADLPFMQEARRTRVHELGALLDDPKRGNAEKFRRVLEAYRTEVDYGHSLGAEDAQGQCNGPQGPVTLVRVGRVGLYCLSADGARAGFWDGHGWQPLEDRDELANVRHAKAVARAEEPPQLLELPVRAASKAP